MLKKILYILGFMMFATIVVKPLVVFSADQGFSGKEEDVPYSSARLFSKIVGATGANPNADWGTSFGTTSDEDVGKDLYMMVYRKVNVDPQQKALKNISGKYGMSETELNRILKGDYSQLFEKKKSLSQEEAQRKLTEIQQVFKEEVELKSLEANLRAAVEPSEIFANGDLSDSGFDLINDLDIIEKILFLKTNPIDVGGAYSGGSDDDGAADSGSGNSGNDSAKTDSPVDTGTGADAVKSGTQKLKGEEGDGSGSGSGGTGVLPKDTLDPNSCFAGDAYKGALKDYEDTLGSKDGAGDEGAPKSGDDGGGDGASGDENIGTTSSALTTDSPDDFLPLKSPKSVKSINPAAPGQWLQDNACDDVFCIFVRSVTAPAKSKYSSSDNCIACHAEKINDSLKKVISHSLIPNKAAGNMMESAKCKKAMSTGFGSISMNFYASPMPIKTPQNDDIIYGKNIEDDWYNYCNAVAFPFGCSTKQPSKDASKVEYTIPPTPEETVTSRTTTMAPENASFDKVNSDIQKGIDAYSLERSVGSARVTSGAESDLGSTFFGPLKTEMDNMSSYFVNFSDILQSLHEKVDTMPGSQACTDIKSKKECS